MGIEKGVCMPRVSIKTREILSIINHREVHMDELLKKFYNITEESSHHYRETSIINLRRLLRRIIKDNPNIIYDRSRKVFFNELNS